MRLVCKNCRESPRWKEERCERCFVTMLERKELLEPEDENTQETPEDEARISHDYDIPTECMKCGGTDLSLRAIYHFGQKMLMLRYVCNECGHSDAIRTKKNQENQHHPSDGALRQWHKQVVQKYGYKCAICGSANKPHAHHIIPIGNNWGDTFKYMPSNGIMLCEDCHNKVHHRNKAR